MNRLEGYTPKVTFHRVGEEWQCDIEHGPGHHGRAKTMDWALLFAAHAWRHYEQERTKAER